MSLNTSQIKIVDDLYRNASLGLLTAPALNKYLKDNGSTGYTIKKIQDYLNSLQTTQTSKLHYSNVSYVAEHPLDQFQIDLVYMPKSWFNHNYKYLLTCIDVFSKKADVIPLKDRTQSTVTDAFKEILSHLGVPKSIYSDQGVEFKNTTFQALLDSHNIQIIFALAHAPFIEAFNKNIKYKLIKYMELQGSPNWSSFLQPVLDAYNKTKHTSTGVAPNDVNSKNEVQVAMKMKKKAKVGSYPDVNEGDNVRLQVVHKTPKGFKQQWSTDLHKVQNDYHNGVYKVDGDLYPRKELQLVKGHVIPPPAQPLHVQAQISQLNRIGQAANTPIVMQLMNTTTPNYQAVATMLQSGKSQRPISIQQQGVTNYAQLANRVPRPKKKK